MNSVEGLYMVPLTAEQIQERNQLKDAIHAQHGLVFVELAKYLSRDDRMYNHDLEAKAAFDACKDKTARALEYYDELLPSKGFWGRLCAKQMHENRELKKQIEELKEYKWKYEDLCK